MSRIQAFAPQHVDLPLGQLAATGQMYQGLTGNPANDLPKLGAGYNAAFQGILGFNSSLLQNQQRLSDQLGQQAAQAGAGISGAYDQMVGAGNQLRTDAAGQNAAINAGYGQLSADVLGGLAGAERSRATDINDAFRRAQADSLQSAVSRGLGNSTVLNSLQRANQSDRERSLTALANEFAQTRAGYQSNLGLAGLADRRRGQEQGVNLGLNNIDLMGRGANELVRQQEQQVGLGRDFLGYLSQIQAPYPDASMFNILSQQAGAGQQAAADRGQLMGLTGAMNRAADAAGGGGGAVGAPTTGGGFLGGTGRTMSGPEANYGGNPTYAQPALTGVGGYTPPRTFDVPNVPDQVGGVPPVNPWSNTSPTLGTAAGNITSGVFGALDAMGYGGGGDAFYNPDMDPAAGSWDPFYNPDLDPSMYY